MTKQEAVAKLLDWYRAQLGYGEGADNWNKYAAMPDVIKLLGWNAQEQPWCDIFTDAGFCACFGLEAASKMTYQPIGKGSALCRRSAQYFRENGAWFETPEPGDVAFFYDSAGVINHQGGVEKVSGGLVQTIEGNRSDKVARAVYALGSKAIAGYGRPKWSVVSGEDAEIPVDEPQPQKPVSDPDTPGGGDEFDLRFRILRRGCVGEDVRALQRNLKSMGFDVGRYGLDGEFGSDTLAALIAYQRSVRLDPDGEAGPLTMAALNGLRKET